MKVSLNYFDFNTIYWWFVGGLHFKAILGWRSHLHNAIGYSVITLLCGHGLSTGPSLWWLAISVTLPFYCHMLCLDVFGFLLLFQIVCANWRSLYIGGRHRWLVGCCDLFGFLPRTFCKLLKLNVSIVVHGEYTFLLSSPVHLKPCLRLRPKLIWTATGSTGRNYVVMYAYMQAKRCNTL